MNSLAWTIALLGLSGFAVMGFFGLATAAAIAAAIWYAFTVLA
jgi:hypothetical protein